VVRYDERGTGLSTRTGPYDLDTGANDLGALIEHLGEPAVIAGTADAPLRGVRVAARRPDLVTAVVAVGGAPIGRSGFERSDTLVASDSVVRAIIQQVETDYRGALRSLLAVTNAQMGEDELRERIVQQLEHVPVEVAAPRMRAWAEDDPVEHSRATGDRLWVCVTDHPTGGWFPFGRELADVTTRLLPEAQVVEIADGWLTRPDEAARVIRSITGEARMHTREGSVTA
jgi:pimeloyl-ACP methyl ester carboxylesterase